MKTISRTKKLVSMALALAMMLAIMLCAAPAALATGDMPAEANARKQTINNPENTEENSVEIPVLAFSGSDATVYSVDVEWGAMTFVYVASTWDPETLTNSGQPMWLVCDPESGEAYPIDQKQTEVNAITVTNKSNAAVDATLSYASVDNYPGINGIFSDDGNATDNIHATYSAADNKILLETADNGVGTSGAGEAAQYTVYFMPDGASTGYTLPNKENKFAKIGNITVTVTPAASTEEP